VGQRSVFDTVEIFHAEKLFGSCDSSFGNKDHLVFFIDGKMLIFYKLQSDSVRIDVVSHLSIRRTRNNKRRTRFIDQDRVNLVDDNEMVGALYHMLF